MMDSDSDRRFWQNFNKLIGALEDPPYQNNNYYTALDSQYTDPVGILEASILAIKKVISDIPKADQSTVETAVWNIILLLLFYIDRFGKDAKVTAAELSGRETTGDKDNQIERLRELVDDKGHDYNSGNISILQYFVWREKSILHEMHKRALRLLSLNKAPDSPKFEDAPSTAFDLCAYGLFFLAYIQAFPLSECESGRDTSQSVEAEVDSQLATLCYIRKDGKTLLLRRSQSSQNGPTFLYNGLGGKVQSGETPRSCAIREIREESGLIAEDLVLKGIVTITGTSKVNVKGRDWYILIYVVNRWAGELNNENPEGTPIWIEDKLLSEYTFDIGDKYFLEHLDSTGWFEGCIRYDGERVVHVEFQQFL
jgi:8-oxo-dGTP diphosphatase